MTTDIFFVYLTIFIICNHPFWITFVYKFKMREAIRDEGPRFHW